MITIELRKSLGQPWGMRIGGGVDRGKVLVIEKVRIDLSHLFIIFQYCVITEILLNHILKFCLTYVVNLS